MRDRRLGFALDASALLALLQGEPGSAWVADVLDVSILSAVNWAEVLGKALEHGADLRDSAGHFGALGVPILPFTEQDAVLVATLQAPGRSLGLSLGDRACLALAHRYEVTALTADRAWAELGEGGSRSGVLGFEVKVQMIR
ncbi:MAG: type II toxin-antitoxin system VapC family toxin [Holophagales bacterium]|nr:type II toxin-antitoxin system VapC family toxin [Holophagales bacterium]